MADFSDSDRDLSTEKHGLEKQSIFVSIPFDENAGCRKSLVHDMPAAYRMTGNQMGGRPCLGCNAGWLVTSRFKKRRFGSKFLSPLEIQKPRIRRQNDKINQCFLD